MPHRSHRDLGGISEDTGSAPGSTVMGSGLQKSPGSQPLSPVHSEVTTALRHQKQSSTFSFGLELYPPLPKATPSWSLSWHIQKYVSWILRIQKEGTETGM